jgi:hypothetical protein
MMIRAALLREYKCKEASCNGLQIYVPGELSE